MVDNEELGRTILYYVYSKLSRYDNKKTHRIASVGNVMAGVARSLILVGFGEERESVFLLSLDDPSEETDGADANGKQRVLFLCDAIQQDPRVRGIEHCVLLVCGHDNLTLRYLYL